MIGKITKKAENKMEMSFQNTKDDLNTVRTGRATPSLVENIIVDYYGSRTPLQQMAKIVAPEPRQLVIEPWDKSAIEDIEKAIMKENLGLTPNNDGNVIRINIPKLTEERRKELVKILHEKAEQGKVSIRNIRHNIKEELEDLEDEGDISEDNYYRALDNLQELTDDYTEKIDDYVDKKEEIIMEV